MKSGKSLFCVCVLQQSSCLESFLTCLSLLPAAGTLLYVCVSFHVCNEILRAGPKEVIGISIANRCMVKIRKRVMLVYQKQAITHFWPLQNFHPYISLLFRVGIGALANLMAEYNNSKTPQWQSNHLKELGSLLKILSSNSHLEKKKKKNNNSKTANRESCLT